MVNLLIIRTPAGIEITLSPATDNEPLMITNLLKDEPTATFQPFAFDFT